MTEVIYTEAARADLLDIWLYICDESLTAADHVLNVLERDVMLPVVKPAALMAGS